MSVSGRIRNLSATSMAVMAAGGTLAGAEALSLTPEAMGATQATVCAYPGQGFHKQSGDHFPGDQPAFRGINKRISVTGTYVKIGNPHHPEYGYGVEVLKMDGKVVGGNNPFRNTIILQRDPTDNGPNLSKDKCKSASQDPIRDPESGAPLPADVAGSKINPRELVTDTGDDTAATLGNIAALGASCDPFNGSSPVGSYYFTVNPRAANIKAIRLGYYDPARFFAPVTLLGDPNAGPAWTDINDPNLTHDQYGQISVQNAEFHPSRFGIIIGSVRLVLANGATKYAHLGQPFDESSCAVSSGSGDSGDVPSDISQ